MHPARKDAPHSTTTTSSPLMKGLSVSLWLFLCAGSTSISSTGPVAVAYQCLSTDFNSTLHEWLTRLWKSGFSAGENMLTWALTSSLTLSFTVLVHLNPGSAGFSFEVSRSSSSGGRVQNVRCFDRMIFWLKDVFPGSLFSTKALALFPRAV